MLTALMTLRFWQLSVVNSATHTICHTRVTHCQGSAASLQLLCHIALLLVIVTVGCEYGLMYWKACASWTAVRFVRGKCPETQRDKVWV